ncbi:MAG: DUF805 domain-containing protein [Alphaproteobacteria bacterium]
MKGNIMSLSEAVNKCFSKYITISGRAGRAEFWWCYLVFASLVYLSGHVFYNSVVLNGETIPLSGWIPILATLVIIPPYLSVIVRRFHDTNHSGHYVWMSYGSAAIAAYLLNMVTSVSPFMYYIIVYAIVGVIIFNLYILWWVIKPGDKGSNKYGAAPKK